MVFAPQAADGHVVEIADVDEGGRVTDNVFVLSLVVQCKGARCCGRNKASRSMRFKIKLMSDFGISDIPAKQTPPKIYQDLEIDILLD